AALAWQTRIKCSSILSFATTESSKYAPGLASRRGSNAAATVVAAPSGIVFHCISCVFGWPSGPRIPWL
ncbi:unnamed protein product, partial [Mycena citricolor]